MTTLSASVLLAHGHYLHQVDFPEKIALFPGNKINRYYIYDVIYSEQPEKNLTKIYYLSKEKAAISSDQDIIFDQKKNIIEEIRKSPDILFCDEHNLSALFFYYKRFRQRTTHLPIIIVQSNALLPFYPIPSKIVLPELPNHVIAAVPYFEDLNIPSRIASTKLEMPGWYEGDLTEMLIKKYKNTFVV
jgi:hypothetical protein